ncbi:phosphopantetheine-binding protein [Streptomyces roseicoloratus]|uniref:Phosphopantetheine-binding protein n=1 Tax=Streptomyces roseicoloratus TaxID=2508722 RepID=A0ABY9S1X0_9ACTN|nr:phosphopantetheine-binding protein [Streptomyces roseicoloratus]WMX48429.1 phosphopantetheine-binding protein [Streptomyces roseicoloratus]
MNRDEARTFVRQAVQRVAPDADFTGLAPDASLRDTFEMDSLDFLEFVEALAELSGRELTEDDYPVLVTWDGCADRLVSATGASASERSG